MKDKNLDFLKKQKALKTSVAFCICFGESSDCGRYSKSPYLK